MLKFAEPIVDNPEEFVSTAKKRHNDIIKLRKYIAIHGDLVHGTLYPDTDIDVLTAIVLRYVHDSIFQMVLFGDMRGTGDVITSIEVSMQNNVEPKRGERLPSIST